ncbi:MAG TPA: SusC/RagA family TonB-linked outer membrane protein [Puia sp.]|nr:SusC/RagA family TonB-linked outer membrane protein [Puia sp.]
MRRRSTLLAGLWLSFFFLPLLTHAQRIVSGRILSEADQNPVAGASVVIKGSKTGASSDVEGRFSIKANSGDVLVVTGVGITSMETTLGDESTISIVVKVDSKNLNEVVVTALGIRKETKRLGYAIQEVKGAELLKAREANPVNNLAGKVAGLNVGINQELLASPVVLLRGNNVTFYVVDGLPINSDTWNISPDDIETFTVLKGPAAAALYGNRGTNGAILITTKRGGKNRKGWTVEVNSSNQINKGFIAFPKVQEQYGPGDNQKYAFGDGLGGGINDADYDVWGPILDGRLIPQYDGKVDPNTVYTTTFADGAFYKGHIQPTPFIPRGKNNMQKFIQTGILTTNNINMSSVTDRSNVRMSVSQSYQRGITPNTGLNKVNFNIFGSYDINSRLRVEGNLNYNRQFSNNIPDVTYGPNSIIYDIDVWMGADWDINAPDIKNYWPADGGAAGVRPTFAEYKHYQNPWFVSNEWLRGHYKNDLFGYINLNYKLGKGFEAQVRSNVSTYDVLRTEKLPWWAHPYSQEYHNHGNYREDRRALWENNTEALIKYNGELGHSGISLFALGGVNVRNFQYTSSFTTTNQLITPELYNFNNSINPIQSWNFKSNMLVLSAYASLDLTYKKYLTLSLTGREDKSSALPLAHNKFFYPSASLSTVISDYVNLPAVISFLKARASFANVKDGGTTPYIGATPTYGTTYGAFPLDYGGQYFSTYGGPSYNLTRAYQSSLGYNNNTQATSTTNIVDPNIVPATHTMYEGGVDIRFLRNRLGVSATYFKYINGPNIYNAPVSQASGYTTYITNALKTDRSGAEISLQGTPIQTARGFRWDVLVNWSTYREIYTSLTNNSLVVGNNYVLHKGDRVDQLTGPKEVRTPDGQLVTDSSGKALYLPVDQALGHGDPDWSWAINNKFTYKNFAISFQFDGMVGGRIQDLVLRKGTEGGRGLNTATGKIGQARFIEAYHFGDPGYTGAYVNGKAVLAEGVKISTPNGKLAFDQQGHVTNFKDLSFETNNTATRWVQDFVSSYYNDPEHTMTSKTYAKLREVVITYSLPASLLGKSMISRVDLSLVGRNLLYFFHEGFRDIDVDQYPGRDMNNNANREYNFQTPTTRSFGFNINVVF